MLFLNEVCLLLGHYKPLKHALPTDLLLQIGSYLNFINGVFTLLLPCQWHLFIT